MIAFTASAMMSSLLGRNRKIDYFVCTQNNNHFNRFVPVYINICVKSLFIREINFEYYNSKNNSLQTTFLKIKRQLWEQIFKNKKHYL